MYNGRWTFWDFRHLQRSRRRLSLSGVRIAVALSDEERTGLSEASVHLQGVSKAFDDFVAVREMDLEIAQGEFFTLLGPSGCGKTTTLRMIAGFEQPTTGSVMIEGTDVAGLPAHKRPTNTVFQSYALFPHLSVGENVAFGLERKKVDRDEIKRRVETELERVGLAAEINRRPNQLSGGMQQRVALARALVNLPEGAAARRAARRPRPEAAQGPAAGAEGHPARGRDHLRLRHPRPGGSADDVGPDRGHEPRPDRAVRRARGRLRAPGHDLRRRLHRRLQPDAGRGDVVERRPTRR